MYMPNIYEKFSEKLPDNSKDYEQLGVSCQSAGPLARKIQDLVKLGIAIGANSEGAVRSHTRKALDSGATTEEILHIVTLSLTTSGFPNMIAAMGWVTEVLEKQGALGKQEQTRLQCAFALISDTNSGTFHHAQFRNLVEGIL